MKHTVQKTASAAMFAAVIFTLTRIVSIPSFTSVGNVNLGDCAILLAAWLLPYKYSFLAAGIGSALADLTSAYAIYAPATFIIKGLMAVVAGIIFNKTNKIKSTVLRIAVSGIIAELVMIAGYFIFEGIFICGFKTALLNIPFNGVQGAVGLISGAVLYQAIKKFGIKLFK